MPKGGMSKNPFAGNNSLSNLDDEFMASLFKGELSVDQTLALRIIKMSVRDYLFFGLGKNGVTPEKFLEAYHYLYKVKAEFVPAHIRAKCFETHYDLSGLSKKLPLESFLHRIKTKRTQILKANEKQVLTYMDKYRAQEWRTQVVRKGKYTFPRVNAIPLLIAPEDVKAFAGLYLFGRATENKATATVRVRPNTLIYKNLLF
jgi:hypothetical protein